MTQRCIPSSSSSSLLGSPSPLLSLLLFLLNLFISPSSAHGYLSHPPARQAGAATAAACGRAVTDAILRDNTSHIEGLPELAAAPGSGFQPARCNLWLCRGIQFADNDGSGGGEGGGGGGVGKKRKEEDKEERERKRGEDRTQRWTAGQTVGLKVRLTIPHDGSANVSIVDTARNEVVGDMLVVWPAGYANENQFFEGSLPVNNTEFNVTLPDVSERCGRAGDCVLQWWWYGKGAKQTYESCVDFVMVAPGGRAGHDTGPEGPLRWRRWIGDLFPRRWAHANRSKRRQ